MELKHDKSFWCLSLQILGGEGRRRVRSWKLFRKLWNTPWHMTGVQMAEVKQSQKWNNACHLMKPGARHLSRTENWELLSQEKGLKNRKNFNLHWECVCVQIGERSSKTNGFPCFETESSFIWFIWQVYIKLPYLITEKWLIYLGGREEESCDADKTKQPIRQLVQHLCAKFQCYISSLRMLTQTPNRPTFSGVKLYEIQTSELFIIANLKCRTALTFDKSLCQMSLF